jgi:hypothetical protein
VSAYRTSAAPAVACRHSWRTETVHFYDGPVIRARCSRCAEVGGESRNLAHEVAWLFPRALAGWAVYIAAPALGLVVVVAALAHAVWWVLS